MGRIQCKGKGKGISSTTTPFKRKIAKWVTHTPKTLTELVVAMAKKGISPSQIGVVIRDKEGVPSTKLLTGQKIVRILKKYATYYVGCAPLIPEDIHCLIRKAISIRKHL
jgi:small subunit ribosomal protein S13e